MDTGKKKGGTLLATCILVGTLCTGVVFAYDDRAMDTSIATMKNIIIPLNIPAERYSGCFCSIVTRTIPSNIPITEIKTTIKLNTK